MAKCSKNNQHVWSIDSLPPRGQKAKCPYTGCDGENVEDETIEWVHHNSLGRALRQSDERVLKKMQKVQLGREVKKRLWEFFLVVFGVIIGFLLDHFFGKSH